MVKKLKSEMTKEEVLAHYQKRVLLMQAQKTPHKDVQPLQMPELLLLRALIHPTAKQESKNMTRELISFICDQGIVTAEDIYSRYKWSDKPVMRRLKLFREFGLIRRESKKYYMPTPRLLNIKDVYLERMCE